MLSKVLPYVALKIVAPDMAICQYLVPDGMLNSFSRKLGGFILVTSCQKDDHYVILNLAAPAEVTSGLESGQHLCRSC